MAMAFDAGAITAFEIVIGAAALDEVEAEAVIAELANELTATAKFHTEKGE